MQCLKQLHVLQHGPLDEQILKDITAALREQGRIMKKVNIYFYFFISIISTHKKLGGSSTILCKTKETAHQTSIGCNL